MQDLVITKEGLTKPLSSPQGGGGGGTLKFSVYIGEADFFGGQNFEFPYFLGFSEKLVIF